MNRPVDPDGPQRPAPHRVRPFLQDRVTPSGGAPGPEEADSSAPRPFIITAGRVTAMDPDIGVETQVTTHPGAAAAGLPPESRAIVALCRQPLSVAEISARLRLHLGVTRVVVGDLRAAGYLDVHVAQTDFPDPETIMRVIRGLRALT